MSSNHREKNGRSGAVGWRQQFETLGELRTLLPYLRRYRHRALAGLVFILFTNAFMLIGPRVLKYAIDGLGAGITARRLMMAGGAVLLVSLLEGTFRYFMRQSMIVMSRLIEYDLRNDYFKHLQAMPRAFYHRNSTGDLMARATNDLGAVRTFVGPGLMYSLNTFVTAVGAFALMLGIDVKLTLYAMIPMPLMAIMVNRFMTRINETFERIQEQFAKISTKAQESLSGIRVIKAYVREQHEIGGFRKLNEAYVNKNLELVRIESFLWSAMGFLSGLGALVLLWLGGLEVMSGRITRGDFVAFYVYLGMLTWPMIALGWVINLAQQGSASMGRINRILGESPSIADSANTNPRLQHIDGVIEFRDVGVSYATDRWALRHISFRIERGMTVAIVGHVGSGKSTLVSLIARLLEASEGQIYIDGHDVRTIPLAALRQHIGFVPQETFLFSDTIRENIAFGVESASDEAIQRAAEQAQIDHDIKDFPEGFATLLGERGINLSGGQKQRVAIARALLREPRILILDDALSSVDTYTEERILHHLRRIMRDRTSLIISHRVSTVKEADLIIVLKDGEIVERGDHDSLLSHDRVYADLYRKQQLEEALEAM
jgi:ATP-binding cassette subfamily B protein